MTETKIVDPEIQRGIQGIILEAALLIDRLNKYQHYGQHADSFNEFLSVDLADLNYYVGVLSSALGLSREDLDELTQVKLAHFYPSADVKLSPDRRTELLNKFSGIFEKYKHARPY